MPAFDVVGLDVWPMGHKRTLDDMVRLLCFYHRVFRLYHFCQRLGCDDDLVRL